MARPNISAGLSAAAKSDIKAKLNEIKALMPFLINLTPKERKRIFKMGPKSVGFVELALRIAQENPNIIPPEIDVTEFAKDVALYSALTEIEASAGPLHEAVDDTLKAVGSEAMTTANRVYDLVKIAAKGDSAVDELRKELGRRYKTRARTAASPDNDSEV